MRTIVVVDHDPHWVETFERVRARVWPAVRGVASSVEHVGSTSVPGLAAKPIVDVAVVVPNASDVPLAIERLATIGYVHRGDLGIEGREAFENPAGFPAHHLYVCPVGSAPLANFRALRDHLRTHPEAAAEYAALKRRLAAAFPHDVASYVAGKSDFILGVLRASGLSAAHLAAIERGNRAPG
ncbi:MAG TPA: GrpB family protein [Vicinamibacteria bacterium]|nr:GrpB family protein [Vicinamibacteria bacterium]